MSTIRERAYAYADRCPIPGTSRDALVLRLYVHAENERELQRQECAEAVRLWLTDDDAGIEMGAWWDELNKSILAAGTEPQNPFGCQCGWERERERPDAQWMFWLRHKGGIHLDHQCDHCPKCGKAKRRRS
jgi:hypothetical protein